MLTSIANAIQEQQLEELIEDVMFLYSKKAVYPMMCGTKEEYVKNFNKIYPNLFDRHIDDAIKELDN